MTAANSYLIFVSEMGVKMSQLKDEFWALSVRKKYKHGQLNGDKSFSKFLVSIRSDVDRNFKRNSFDRINGQSNLNSSVLDFCLECLAIKTSSFDGYRDFIDNDLIDKRNFIAHGNSLKFEADDVSIYRDKVIELMRLVHNEFENSVIGNHYLK